MPARCENKKIRQKPDTTRIGADTLFHGSFRGSIVTPFGHCVRVLLCYVAGNRNQNIYIGTTSCCLSVNVYFVLLNRASLLVML